MVRTIDKLRPSWVRLILCVWALCLFGCSSSKGKAVGDLVEVDGANAVYLVNVQATLDRLDDLANQLPATGSLGDFIRVYLGISKGAPATQMGYSEGSDVVIIEHELGYLVGVGRCDPDRLIENWRARFLAQGYRHSDGQDSLRLEHPQLRRAVLFQDRSGVATMAWFHSSAGRPLQQQLLDQSFGAKTPSKTLAASVEPGALMKLHLSADRLEQWLPLPKLPLGRPVDGAALSIFIDEGGFRVKGLLRSSMLSLLGPLFQPKKEAERVDSLSDELPLHTASRVRVHVNPGYLDKLPRFLGRVKAQVMAPFRHFPLGAGNTTNYTNLGRFNLAQGLIPYLDGPIDLLWFGFDTDLVQRAPIARLRRLASSTMGRNWLTRWGWVIELNDPDGFVRYWSGYARHQLPETVRVVHREEQGDRVVELHRSDRSYNSFLAGLILRGSRLFVIKANQDFDAIRRVRDKKATALSRRWANDATGAPLKTDANLASFSQFVRVTRELELTGMPTFHLQLLGSVYQILTHWRVAPKGLDVTLQWDWML